jgi:hypothetical protein
VNDLVLTEASKDMSYDKVQVLRGKHSWENEDIQVREGTMCIYAGSEEVPQKKGRGIVRAQKHCFVVGTGRYCVEKLSLLKPAELA